jgi:acyl carrier protein
MLPVHLSNNQESNLDIKQELLSILDEILSLNGRAASFKEDAPLLGAIPELDSMAVVALITAIEERFGVAMEDDEIDGSIFATVGSLTGFVQSKVAT